MDGETTAVSEEPGARARTIRRFLLLLLFVAVAATVGFLLAPTDVAVIRDWSADAGWAGVLLFGIAYAALTLTPVPKNVLGIAAGLVWGFPLALTVVYLGALCGAAASFWIGRALGREAVERFTGARVARLDAAFAQRGLPAVLGLRLVPVIPFTLINYGSGLTSVRKRDYALGTAIGILPGSAAYVALGAFGWDGGPGLWISLAALGVLLLGGAAVVAARRRRASREAHDA